MADIRIKIIYRDGTEEEHYIDSYKVQDAQHYNSFFPLWSILSRTFCFSFMPR